MSIDTFKPKGQIAANKPGKGGSGSQNVPVIGVVRDNVDPTRSGRIRVSLVQPNSSPNPQDSTNWITVSFLSSFFGKVDGTAGNDGYGTYKSNPSSYGQWQAPPDIGTQVVCIFINGDMNYGYYIGAIPEPESLQMVPAIGSSDNIIANTGEAASYGGATRLPVTNLNANDKKLADSAQFLTTPRPVHSYSAAIMNQQGIIRDPIRGPISSSASRETVSRVGWGVSSPGRPIYTGGYDDTTLPASLEQANPQGLQVVARRGGHSIVMDDGDIIGRDQLIRIRTALGHQILMSDDGQTLMILHSNGQSYIELGKEGTIDMYSTNSVNIRTQGDLNLHADRDVNIHAKNNLNVYAKQIHTDSENNTLMVAGGNINTSSGGDITGRASGSVAYSAGRDASLAAGGQAYINGSKVNLNSGSASTTPASVPALSLAAQTDTLFDSQKGFIAAPGSLLTIASRAPAHCPWVNAGQGVDVQTSLNASDNLPTSPATATSTAIINGASTGAQAPAAATVASVPANTAAASTALDTNTTMSMVASQATSAASGPLSAAVTQGSAIVNTSTGPVAAIGAFGLTPSILVQGGILKPGSDILINGLIQQGANIETAIPSSLFTGQYGINDLPSLIQSMSAQTNTVVSNLQKSQSALGQLGAIAGNESPAVIAGLVQSAATTGVAATASAIQQVSGIITDVNTTNNTSGPGLTSSFGTSSGSLSGAVSDITNGVSAGPSGSVNQVQSALRAIGSGLAAADQAAIAGGQGGISNSLVAIGSASNFSSIINKIQGVVASGFFAIKNSLATLQSGVPQNLTAIAQNTAVMASAQSAQTTQTSDSIVKSLSGSASNISSTAGSLNTLASSAGSVSGADAAINNSVAGVTGSVTIAETLISQQQETSSQNKNSSGSVTTTVGGITAIASTAASNDGSVLNTGATPNPLNPTVSGESATIATINAISGAGAMITTGNIRALSSAASTVQQGASASTSSLLASGLNNLPGGINTVSSVVNNVEDATNIIPGTGSLTSLINAATSAAMNESSSASEIDISNLTGNLGSLESLATSGLSVGATAQLTSAIMSLSSGSGGTTLPVIGYNTNNRTEITSQITSVLNDPGIPAPNLVGSITQNQISTEQVLLSQGQQLSNNISQLASLQEQVNIALNTFVLAQQTYAAGDPAITTALNTLNTVLNNPTYISLTNQLNDNASSSASSTAIITEANASIANLSNSANSNVIINSSTQTSTALQTIQTSLSTDEAAINNSISGITGI